MTALVARALERQLHVYRRTWRGSAFSVFVQPVLFLGAMGLGLGGLVDDGGELGADYIGFVAPGLLVAAGFLSASGEGLWGIMGGVKWMGQFNAMVATPMTPGDVFGGHVLYAGVRAFVAAVPFLVVAAAMGGVSSWFAPVAVVPTVLVTMLCAAWLSAYSVLREDDSTFPIIMRLGIVPLFLFSGTFFPVDQLPDAAEPLAWLSPLWHAAEVARDATAGGLDGWSALHVLVLGAVLAAAVPIGTRNFTRRLTP